MLKQIIFIEDNDVEYIQALSQWASDRNILLHVFENGNKFLEWFENADIRDSLIIVDYFLPDWHGSDLILYLIKQGVNPDRILITSISDNIVYQIQKYFNLTKGIIKRGVKYFIQELEHYYVELKRVYLTEITVSEYITIDLEYGMIFDQSNLVFDTLTSREKEFLQNAMIIKHGLLVAKIRANKTYTSLVWRLNKKLKKFQLRLVKQKDGYNYLLVFDQS